MEPSDLLADRDYGFQMRFIRNEISSFFRAGENFEAIIAKRREILDECPERCLAMLPEGVALLDEVIALGRGLQTFPSNEAEGIASDKVLERLKALGEMWEADVLLMKADEAGVFRMVGGCLCFPSHWDLHAKMGRSMFEIHKPVPTLNETLGNPIDRFLERIKPGISWERFNWGLNRSPEFDQHPSRKLPRLDEGVGIDEVWWRLEEQSLVALPESKGILFGIKLRVLPMSEIKADAKARVGMIQALKTMPESVANFKGISQARERLVELMEN